MLLISKKEVSSFLDGLINNYQVFAPVKKDGYAEFEQIKAGTDAYLECENTKKPAKQIFFPQSEEMFSYCMTKDGVKVEEKLDETKKVIFGVRPCDAKSLNMLDKVFNNDLYQDVYYAARRKNTILFAIGCNEPNSTCFCTSFGIGPMSEDGADVFMIDTGDSYVVKAVTEKGKEILANAGSFNEASEEDLQQAEKIKEQAVAGITSKVEVTGLKEKLDGMFDSSIWDTLHEKCLGCGACTYLCPTCHCFDITDDAVNAEGERVRNWDSCMFPLFTLHGSGHNPRPTGKERIRQRVMHKFNYFVKNFGETACVGCGRCIKNCPVNLDIREVIGLIQEQQDSEARLVK